MADIRTAPRSVRLQRAMQGAPLADKTRDELAEIADLARLGVEGTGKDGHVTAEDYRAAIEGRAPLTTTRVEPVSTEEEE